MAVQTTVATRPLRIAIDYTSAINQNAGIGRFVRNLVNAVVANDTTDAFLLLHAAPNPGRVPNYPGGSNVSTPRPARQRALVQHHLAPPPGAAAGRLADRADRPVPLAGLRAAAGPGRQLDPDRPRPGVPALPGVRRRPPARVPGEDGPALGPARRLRRGRLREHPQRRHLPAGRAAGARDRRAGRRRSGLQARHRPRPPRGVPPHARPRSGDAVHPVHRRDRAAQEPDGPDRGVRHPEVAPLAAAQAGGGRPAGLALRVDDGARRALAVPERDHLPRLHPGRRATDALLGGRGVRVPLPLRGVRPAGPGGDGLRDAGGRLARKLAAGGRRRRRHAGRPRRFGAARLGAGAAGAQPGDARRLPRARHRPGGDVSPGTPPPR